MNMKANWKTILSRCVLFVITAVTAIPLLWLVVLSFKSDTDILNNPFSLPEHIDLANYERALDCHYLKCSAIHLLLQCLHY